jgi:hypothetical protein
MARADHTFQQMVAALLTREEREAVLGDLSEAGTSAWQGALEILGLVIRRQAALWYDWRPWLAAFGAALPGTLLLQGVSFWLSCTYYRLIGTAACAACWTDGRAGLVLLLVHVLLLITWSWTSGFVVGSISRRTLWASVAISLCPCAYCLTMFRERSISRASLLLFIPPAILGVYDGLRIARLKPGLAFAVALSVTALMICAWTSRALSVLNWALILPAWYIALTASRSNTLIEKGTV